MQKTPIIRPISWINAGVNIGVLIVFFAVGWGVGRANGVLCGAAAYVALSQILRLVIARHHRKAIRHCKRQEFELAIPEFQKSIKFFRDHAWIDRFRAITMLSAAGMAYREMGMVSLAFCYAQMGDGNNARSYYEQCLQEYPDNGLAESALKLLDAGAKAVSR